MDSKTTINAGRAPIGHRPKIMKDVRQRPGRRFERLVSASSWTLRGGRNRQTRVIASEAAGCWALTLPYATVRARRHLLR